jgi:hypothetical protein
MDIENMERTLENARENLQVTYKGIPSELKARRVKIISPKIKLLQPRLLYLAQLSSMIDEKVNLSTVKET